MTSFAQIGGILAGVLTAFAWILYNVHVSQKKTRPNRATWSILTLVGILILISYYDGGARETLWVPAVYVIGTFITALLSVFYYGEGGWTPFDKRCLAIAIGSVLVWFILRSYVPHASLAVLLINIGIDFVGLLPTIRKSWCRPRFEDPTAWIIEFLSSFINLFAVTTWALTIDSFSIWVYPTYLATVNGIIALILVLRGTKKLKKRFC
jgi:hypothetical protein